ncbi:MFS transporter [Pseudoclavibacter sp. 13-3]|uniref:MFS transporter n=1 Tax=Pseudoclavibacter sp. 13-3 TaxID=2901228 RepID=UPI003FA69C4C
MSVTSETSAATASTAGATEHRHLRRSLAASAVGNALEWFDWTVYAIFSTYIAGALFDQSDSVSALLGTLLVFAVGFIARPVGGMVFGALADRYGRKVVLVTTMLTTAGGSLLIGIAPSYEAVGGWASFVLLIARLAQGFAHGGESTASYAYVAEIAPPKRRGLWSSSVYVSIGAGTLLATLFGSLLTSFTTSEQMHEWGWRVPFIAGALLAVVVLFMRRGMVESLPDEEPAEQSSETGAGRPLSPRALFMIGLKMFIFVGGTSVVYYTWNSFASTVAISQRGMDAQAAFTASLIAQIIGIVALPFAGMLSDRIGRKPMLVIWAAGFAVLALPLMGLISTQSWTLLVAQAVALTLNACATAIFACVLSEQVPTRYRTKVLGISMSLSVAVFGGTTPYLNTWLTSLGLGWVFNLYFIALCVASLIVVLSWRETAKRPLAEIEDEILGGSGH